MNNSIHIISSLSPLLFIYGGLLYVLLTQNLFGIYFAINIFLFGNLVNQGIKYICKENLYYLEWMHRPNEYAKCGYYVDYNLPHDNGGINWGFPSGHMQTALLASTLIIGYMYSINYENKEIYSGLLTSLCIYIGFSRYYLECHNLVQILAGSFLGIIFGIILIFIWIKFKKLYLH